MPSVRILIIRFSSIGDIVLTTPVVRALKTQLQGDAEIHYFTRKSFGCVLENNPYIDHLHYLADSLTPALDQLEHLSFDYIVDLQNNFRSSLTKKRLKSLSFTVDKLNWKKWLLVRTGINLMPDMHLVQRYMETVQAFALIDDGKGLDYFIAKEEVVNLALHKIDGKFIAIVVGGNHLGKIIPESTVLEVASKVNIPLVLLGDKNDRKRYHEIADKHLGLVNLCGKLSLNQSASVVSQAEVVLSGDTGLMHIAAAFQKKIVSVWGCTSPLFGMSPYRAHPSSVLIEPSELKKRPCSKLGNRCKYGMENRCISHVPPLLIAEAVEKLIYLS